MNAKPWWFRHKSIGYGFTPASWQGWLCVLGLLLVAVATMALLGDPPTARPGAAAEQVARWRAALGLAQIRLPLVARFALVAAEVMAFWAFARTRTAPDPP